MKVTEFFSEDKTRTGVVYKREQGYEVELYKDHIHVRTIKLHDKSIYYAEDAAENWTLGILV